MQVQRKLAGMVCREDRLCDVRTVAGTDNSAPDANGVATCAVVVLSFPELELVETKVLSGEVTFPYVPGLLSFREAPLILAACEELETEPDLFIVDGQGEAHPRRMGLACHVGLMLDKPTIGCAKSRLCGTHERLGEERGSRQELRDEGEVIGAVLRTRDNVSPVYVSIGHRVTLEAAVHWVLSCCKGVRLPEPTRQAHRTAGFRSIAA